MNSNRHFATLLAMSFIMMGKDYYQKDKIKKVVKKKKNTVKKKN